jgi:hypothetical protein
MEEALSSGLYRICFGEEVWATVAHMELSISLGQSWTFAGFLNFSWLEEMRAKGWDATNDTVLSWSVSLALFAFSCLAAILDDHYLSKSSKSNVFRPFIVLLILFIPSLIYWSRIEIYVALALFYVAYLFLDFAGPEDGGALVPLRQAGRELARNGELYGTIAILTISLTMIFSSAVWAILPSAFLNAQFPFRVWSIAGFFIFFLGMLLARLAKNRKTALQALAFGMALLFALCQAPVDKRIAYFNGAGSWKTITEDTCRNLRNVGSFNEYAPEVFFEDDYVSPYPNSLYAEVRSNILATWNGNDSFPQTHEDYLDPACLEGSGSCALVTLNTPDATFAANVATDQAYFQIPQFYYDGYEIRYASSDGTSGYAKALEQDGLLAFRLPKGELSVDVTYVGSESFQIGRVLLFLATPSTIALGVGGHFLSQKEKKRRKHQAAQPGDARG